MTLRKNLYLGADETAPLYLANAEAEAIGVSLSRLVSADLSRLRTLARDAEPKLTEMQWQLLEHVVEGTEQSDILAGVDAIPSAGRIAAAVADWISGHDPGIEPAPQWALDLYAQIPRWSPLAVMAVLYRLRGVAVRQAERAEARR